MEHWKPVPLYEEFYQISSLGRIKSLDRVCRKKDGREEVRRGRILKPSLRAGYPFVNLAIAGINKQVHIHRLVAESFCKKKDGCNVVNHIDGVKTNNSADNLEWTTAKGNAAHAAAHGLLKTARGSLCKSSKLDEEKVNDIRRRLINGESGTSVGEIYGVGPMCISSIKSAKSWSYGEGIDMDLVDLCKRSKSYSSAGSSHPMSKIDEEIAKKITNALISGAKLVDIATEFNVIPATVSNINRGRAWSECIASEFGPPPYSPRTLIRRKLPS